MRTVWVSLSVLSFTFLTACNQPTKFDQSSFSTKEQVSAAASSYWAKDGWWNFKKPVKKVAVIDFNVEYVTGSDEGLGGNQLNLLTLARVAGVGQKKMQFEESLKEKLPTQLYAQFVQELQAAGYEVVPAATVVNHPVYAQFIKNTNGENKWKARQRVWGGNNAGGKEVEVYAAKDLVAINASPWLLGANDMKEAEFAGALGVDATLRVRIRLGIEDNKPTVEKDSTLRFLEPQQVWGTTDKWSAATMGRVHAKKTFFFDETVVSKTEFEAFKGDVYTIQSAPYEAAVTKVFPTFARMGVSVVK